MKIIKLTWFVLLAVLALGAAGRAAPGLAQEAAARETAAREAPTLFTGQPPLTEGEVKKYLSTMSKVIKSGGDPARMKAAVDEEAWEQLRFAYVNIRINSAMEVIKGGEEAKIALRAGLRPTNEEVALVKPYQARLENLNEQALELINQRRGQTGNPADAK